MVRIQIKDTRGGRDRRSLLWATLGQNDINPWKIIDGRNNFIVLLPDDATENILNTEIKNQLIEDGFEIVTPPEFN